MYTDEKLVPSRRFQGFNHDWEQREFGEITTTYSGGTPFVGKDEFYAGNIPFIRSSEINSNTTELSISEKGLQNSSAKIVNVGDILYALYGATSGEVGISQIQGAINQAILAIKPNQMYDSQFIMQLLRRKKQNILDKYLQGGQGNLSGNIIKSLKLMFPEFNEQKKIGEFFENLDNLIASQQRKLNKTKAMKSAYLSEMFPAVGDRKPKRRFAGFTDDWEQCKIGDFSKDTYGGGTPKTSVKEYWNGDIPWIQSSDLYEHQFTIKTPTKRITKDGFINSSTKLIPANSIAIVTRVGVGKLAFIPYDYATSQDFLSLSKLKINEWFGVYSLYHKLQSQLDAVQGTSIKGITKEELLNKSILIPLSKIEQKKIGEFFVNLDTLITSQQQKLVKLQNMKKAYLNEMFI